MPTILVVDDMPIFREPIAAALRGAGYRTVAAANGKEALDRIHHAAPDLILLDLAMPVMDGFTFLGILRSNPHTRNIPVILLTAASDKGSIVQAGKLGIQDYLLKSRFSLQHLLERIAKILASAPSQAPANPAPTISTCAPGAAPVTTRASAAAPSPSAHVRTVPPTGAPVTTPILPKLLTREQTLQRLDNAADCKTMAGVVAHVISLAASPRTSLDDLVELINTDPILATRVLQLANSSAYVSNKPRITSVEEAARNIGIRGIQTMAMSVGIFNAFPPDEADGFNTMRCWQHSFAVADLMNLLATDPASHGLHHLVGLCHDMGDMLLRQHFKAEYEQILAFAGAHKLPLRNVQASALGIRHSELLTRLLGDLGLPDSIVDVIQEFAEAQSSFRNPSLSSGSRLLAAANSLAHGLLLAPSASETVAPITRAEWRSIAGNRPPAILDAAAKRSEILAATNLLARLPAADERRLMKPLLQRLPLRICYVRPENYTALDPLASALSLLTREVAIHSTMPAPDELAAFDAVIAVGIRVGARPVILHELQHALAAVQRTDLPLLALVAAADDCLSAASPTPPSLHLRQYPITLHDLHRWLAAVTPISASTEPGESRDLEPLAA